MATQGMAEKPAWWGLLVGSLRSVHADRIVLGETTLFLRPGETCPCVPGIIVKVTYRQHGARAEVDNIAPDRAGTGGL
jgi:hypothetical protein